MNQIKGGIPLSLDKRHMHELFGRYALSLLWARCLFNVDLKKNIFYPSDITVEQKYVIDKIRELCVLFLQENNY